MINKIPVDIILKSDKAKLPTYATDGSAGMDLYAAIKNNISIYPGGCEKIPTDIAIQLRKPGYFALGLPKSGFGSRGAALKNMAGIIDYDYQGNILLNIWNTNKERPITIEPGMAIAQLLILPYWQAEFNIVKSFEKQTERGEMGFGQATAAQSRQQQIIHQNCKRCGTEFVTYAETVKAHCGICEMSINPIRHEHPESNVGKCHICHKVFLKDDLHLWQGNYYCVGDADKADFRE